MDSMPVEGKRDRNEKWKVRIPSIPLSGEATGQWVIPSLMPLATSASCVFLPFHQTVLTELAQQQRGDFFFQALNSIQQ